MSHIFLKSSYDEFLKNTKPQTIDFPVDTAALAAAGEAPVERSIIIPPLNTNVNFASGDAFSFDEVVSQASLIAKKLPVNFNWRDNLPSLSPPDSQGRCGSCWAVATARVINDVFLISGFTPYNIGFSGTYILCQQGIFQNNKCGGGNPIFALQYLEKNGFSVGDTYDWCKDEPRCSKPRINDPVSTQQLNSAIRCSPPKSNVNFRVKNIKTSPMSQTDDSTKTQSLQRMIQNHIITIGPVISGFTVLSNMVKGNFQVTDGIYLEDVDYENSRHVGSPCTEKCLHGFFDLNNCGAEPECLACLSCQQKHLFKKPIGGHAVGIVGWGIGSVDGVFLGKKQGTIYQVPYWHVRNSWGKEWANGGFYKHAMYPFNKISNLEIPNYFYSPDSKTRIAIGGIVMFEADPSINIRSEKSVGSIPGLFFVGAAILFVLFVFLMVMISVSPRIKNDNMKKNI